MGRYLATHRVTSIFTSQDEWLKDWSTLRQRAQAHPGSPRWLLSYYAAESGKLYCEWEAASKEEIRACFTDKELEMAPFESMEEIVRIDPAWLD
jgi:hypothetical protein